MANCIEMEAVSQNPPGSPISDCTDVEPQSPTSSMSDWTDVEAVASQIPLLDTKQQEAIRKPLLDTKEKKETWKSVQLKPKHTIFLSHSGAQKNFVEQLCEDLERAAQSPFFDKRPDSLPKGEKFAQLIFQAAQQCQLAIVVVSEEYFSRSKWPMLELATFAQAPKCTILPLFYGISYKEFADVERRQRWFERWQEWAQEDPRIQVDVWKEALHELDRRNGMEYVGAFGEVAYRRDVVATACAIVHKNVQLNQILPLWTLYLFKHLGILVIFICISVIMIYFFFTVLVPFFDSFIQNHVQPLMDAKMENPMFRSECKWNGKLVPCSNLPFQI